MENNLQALNNILFEQIERINDDDLDENQLNEALKKADHINRLAGTIVQSMSTQLKAYEALGGKVQEQTMKMLGARS